MSEETPNLSFWVTPEKTIKNGCVKDDIFLSKFCLRIRAHPAKGVKKRHLNSRRKFPLHKNWLQFTIESCLIPLILFRGLNVSSRCGEANFLGYIYDKCKYFSLNCWFYHSTRRRVEHAHASKSRLSFSNIWNCRIAFLLMSGNSLITVLNIKPHWHCTPFTILGYCYEKTRRNTSAFKWIIHYKNRRICATLGLFILLLQIC